MEMTFSEALGWAGSLSYVAAYLLLSLKKISADRPLDARALRAASSR